MAGHELLGGGCLLRCASAASKRLRSPEDAASPDGSCAAEALLPRAKRLQRTQQARGRWL
jgi:hypothetical protein